MAAEKSHPFQMRADPRWLVKVDDWRRTQGDLPSRAEAIRRLVEMGLRFGLTEGDKVSTPAGPATVKAIHRATNQIEVRAKNGDGYAFPISEIKIRK